MKKLFQGLQRRNPLCKLREMMSWWWGVRLRQQGKENYFPFIHQKTFLRVECIALIVKIERRVEILIKNNFPTCPHHHDALFIFLIP